MTATIGSLLSRLDDGKRSKSASQAFVAGVFAAIFITVLGSIGPRESLRVIMRSGAAEAADTINQGFGATTPGGSGGAIVHVTNLDDSGPGSFRDAVSSGNRIVVFDVGGEIVLTKHVFVRGAFITIDGSTAPPPGITFKNYGLFIRGIDGTHDVIVRGIRVRDSLNDGILIKYGAYNIVIDHVSIDGSADGNIDITEDSHDVTVSWSILGDPIPAHPKSMLIKYNPSRVSLHHNIFKANQRNPQVRIDDAGTPATDTTVDMRNNLVWGWGDGYGTLIYFGPRANIVDNFYSSGGGIANNALIICSEATLSVSFCNSDPASVSRAYVAGNISGDGLANINNVGTEGNPFPAPLVDTVDACTAAHWVLAEAGVRPLDAVDQQYVSEISLPACGNAAPSVSAGVDQTITLPASASLDGTVTDDGLPNPPSKVTTSWTKISGPGTASFGNLSAIDTTASFTATGTYVLRLTASDGALSSSDDVTVTVNPAPTGQAVVSFTLINARTNQPIATFNPLNSGATLNLATLPTRNLYIRANTSPATVGSVRFGLDGKANYQTENRAPYDAGIPSLGLHTLIATPYTRSNASGTAGTALTITFSVIDKPN